MDLFAGLVQLWHGLSSSVGGDAIAILVVSLVSVILWAVWRVQAAFVETEFWKQNEARWKLVDSKVIDVIFQISIGNVDLTEYEAKAALRKEQGLPEVDPRMLYLIDRVGTRVKEETGLDIDFLDLWARAERILDEVKNAPTNSVS